MPVRGVFFDLYGTLLNYDNLNLAWKDWLNSLYGEFTQSGIQISPDDFSVACRGFYDDLTFFRRQASDHLTVFEERIKRLADKLGVSLSDIHATADNCAAAWQRHISIDHQAEPLLRELKNDRTLTLVSNFDHPPHVRRLLKQSGWISLFDHVVISGEVGVQKPDTRIFEHALALSSLSADEVIHVGDSFADDVLGAYGAGIVPVFLNKNDNDSKNLEFSPISADYERNSKVKFPSGTRCIRQLSEVVDVFEDISR